MREFTFRFEYEAGADPVTDVFIDHPNLRSRSVESCVSEDGFWRVERLTGPTNALDRLAEVRSEKALVGESITETDCAGTRYRDVLDRTSEERVVYTYATDVGGCESVHTLAGRYLPPGFVAQTLRRDHRHEWRLLVRSDEKIGLLYDALGAKHRGDLSFRVGHLRDATGWRPFPVCGVSLSAAQRSALEAAVEYGYYEVPRSITLEELATALDVPRSTLSYRLRRAESRLAQASVFPSEER